MADQIDIKIKTSADNAAVKQTAEEIKKLTGATEASGEGFEKAEFKYSKVKKSLKELAHEIPGMSTAMFALANPIYAAIVALGLFAASIVKAMNTMSDFARKRYDFGSHLVSIGEIRKALEDAREEAEKFREEIDRLENKSKSPKEKFDKEKQSAEKELQTKLSSIGATEKSSFARLDAEMEAGNLTPQEHAIAKQKVGDYWDQQRQLAHFTAGSKVEMAAKKFSKSANENKATAEFNYSILEKSQDAKPVSVLEKELAMAEGDAKKYGDLGKDLSRRVGEFSPGSVDLVSWNFTDEARKKAEEAMFSETLTGENGGLPEDLKGKSGFDKMSQMGGAQMAIPVLEERAMQSARLAASLRARLARAKTLQKGLGIGKEQLRTATTDQTAMNETLANDVPEFLDAQVGDVSNLKENSVTRGIQTTGSIMKDAGAQAENAFAARDAALKAGHDIWDANTDLMNALEKIIRQAAAMKVDVNGVLDRVARLEQNKKVTRGGQ